MKYLNRNDLIVQISLKIEISKNISLLRTLEAVSLPFTHDIALSLISSGEFSMGEMSIWGNFRLGNCPSRELSVGKISLG